jgi:DNA polymerase I-like protein with 3'-5' exonuclease and polymerase domains
MRLTFDLETTNLSYGSASVPENYIVMLAYQIDGGPIYRVYGEDLPSAHFREAYDKADVICAFNAKFEQKWMLRNGFDIDKPWHDPMLAERVIQGNMQLPMNLGAVAERYGFDLKDPVIDSMMKSGVCPSEMPQERLMARCARDVRTTDQILLKQLEILKGTNRLHVYRTRVDFCNVLSHIETEGMQLDEARVYKAYGDHAVAAATARLKLDQITGGINLRSPDQVAHFVYGTLGFPERKSARGKPLRNKPSKQFPHGRPKTDKATMTWLEGQATTDRQREFIELRQIYSKANAALVKNLEFFKGVVDEREDRKFFAQFNQTVAATHRLTSSGIPIQFKQFDKPKSVQFQNMPREFKGLFDAPEGYDIVEVDAAQLEVRGAAFLWQDEQAMQDIADPDFDAHCTSAAVMEGIPYESFLRAYRGETTEGAQKAAKRQRTAAKADTFKPLFGGTKGTEKQEKWYKEFQNRYSGIYATQEGWVADVARDGTLILPWGMRFYWDTEMRSNGMLMCRRTKRPVGPQVFNYPVQSLATAEIVPIAIISLWKRCKEMGLDVKFVNTVHDSVICYVKDSPIAKHHFTRACELAFTRDVYEHLEMHYGITFNVPLGCGITSGKNWGEGEEYIYDDVDNRSKAA